MTGNIFGAVSIGVALLGIWSLKRPVRRFAILFAAIAVGLVGDFLHHQGATAIAHGVLAVLCAVALAKDVALRAALRRRAILDYLAARPQGAYGLDLCDALKVGSGSLYPLLYGLQDDGSVRSWWDEDSHPQRKLYGLADDQNPEA